MRKYTFLFMYIFVSIFLSCTSTLSVEKPDNLISESLMVNVLYEIIILDAMSTFKPRNKDFEEIYGKPYIFLKYGVDSLQLAKSDQYYAKFPRAYHRIYSRVLEKMKKTKDSLDLLIKNEK